MGKKFPSIGLSVVACCRIPITPLGPVWYETELWCIIFLLCVKDFPAGSCHHLLDGISWMGVLGLVYIV